MIRRIVAVVILLLIAFVIAIALGVVNLSSILPAGIATDLALPTGFAYSIPTTLAAIGDDLTNQNPPEPATLATALPESFTPEPTLIPTLPPIQNGRIVYLGVDEKVYSIDPVTKDILLLGNGADFHIFPGQAWYSPDGRNVLAINDDGITNMIHAIRVDGTQPGVIIGEFDTKDYPNTPHLRFEFSPDSTRIWFMDHQEGNLFIHIIDLPGGLKRSMPLQASQASYSLAGFLGSGEQLVVATEGSTANEAILNMYRVTSDNLVLERELARIAGWRVNQIAVSPNGKWVAAGLIDESGSQSLYLLDTVGGQNATILQGSGMRILMQPPAWTQNSRYVLINRWQQGQSPAFSMLTYDTHSGILATLLEGDSSSIEGNPLGVVNSFAPDGNAVGLSVYDSSADSVNYWVSILDGSYLRLAGKSEIIEKLPQGDFVAGISPDWTKMVIVSPEPGLPLGNLFSAALDGTQRVLMDGPVPYRFLALGPVISPNGQQVAYMRLDISGGSEIAELCVTGLDGQGKTILLGEAKDVGNATPGIPLVWLPNIP